MTTDEHHDQRYEDGDYSTGTVADYEDWLSEDGESQWLPIPPWSPVQQLDAPTGRGILAALRGR